MAFWVLLAIFVATTVVMALLTPRPPGRKPSALGDFQAPTAEEGRVIPVIAGTVKIAGPNVIWYGGLDIRPIKKRSGLFSKTTVAYKYFLTMWLALCHGPIEPPTSVVHGAGTGHLTMTYSRPLGNWFWAVLWSDFTTPTLPEDAVVEGIYAVLVGTRTIAPANKATLALAKAGANLDPWNLNPGGTTILQNGTSAFSGEFYVLIPGSPGLSWLDTATLFARFGSSLFDDGITDEWTITAVGVAVYYSSATPSDDSNDIPAPVEIPAGQGVAWSYPQAVEAGPGIPYGNGTAEGAVSVSESVSAVALFAGQAPDDDSVPLTVVESTDDSALLSMEAPELFGGEDREGGLGGFPNGYVRLYRGTMTQPSDDWMSNKLGLAVAPAYHGLVHAVHMRNYFGTSNYLKNLNWVLKRYPQDLGLPASVYRIGPDANPIEFIYEAMTNTIWGLAEPTARFDLTNWQAAAIRIASEGMGVSLQWDTQKEADELIADLLRHIDAVMQTDPRTGLWIITLIREDYDPDQILALTEADLLEAPEMSIGSWEETFNEVKIQFTRRDTFKPGIAQEHDSANESVVGDVVSTTLDFLGFTDPEIAQSVAMRELKTHSFPFQKGTIKAKRKAWPLRIGSPFRLQWAPTGLDLVMRVLNINYGELARGVIEIACVQDAFAVAHNGLSAPAATGWTDPIADPEPPAAQLLVEAPFEWLSAPVAQERVLVGAVRADSFSRGYEIWADEGSGFYKSNTSDRFCPSGILTADYLRTTSALDATGLTLQNEKDLDDVEGTDAAGRVRGDCLLLFEDTGEICAFQTVTDNEDGTFTFANIVRGVYDTLPADHPQPDSIVEGRVFVIRDAGTWYLVPYKADEAESIEAGGDQFIVVED